MATKSKRATASGKRVRAVRDGNKRQRPEPATKPAENLPAPPAPEYQPTKQEKRILARLIKRRDTKPTLPLMEVTKTTSDDGATSIELKVEHEDEAVGYAVLASAIAVDDYDFMVGQLRNLGKAANRYDAINESALNHAIRIVAGIEPKDHVEALLATQMAAIHMATMDMAGRLGNAPSVEIRSASEKSLNRLARTYVAQVEALKRYRSKGEQRVYVERVDVKAGGQAIVGNVARGGGGEDEN